MYNIYEQKIDGLIHIVENKDKKPLDKIIQLAEEPRVGVIPYGPNAGLHAVWVRVSFSPLDSFPYDHAKSRKDDPDGLRLTVREISNIVSNKIPSTVYIVGGEPMYRWDAEIRHLVEELLERDKQVFVETSGVAFPNMYQEILDEEFGYAGANLVIKPQIVDAVPQEEGGGYRQFLTDMLKRWRQIDDPKTWVFDIKSAPVDDIVQQMIPITALMHDVFDEGFNGETLVFVTAKIPTYREEAFHMYEQLKQEIGKLLLNYEGATVLIQPTLEL